MVANPTSKSSVENLSGSGKTELADYSGGNFNFATVPRGIHVNVDGTLVVRFEGDSSDRSLVLFGGQYYPYRIKSITQSGSTAGMGIIGLI